MTKTVVVSAAVGASLLVTYLVAGGPAFWFAAIAAGLVALTWSAQRRVLGGNSHPGTPGLTAFSRAFSWVFCGVIVAMVGMVISMGVRQLNPMYLLFLAMMGLGWYSVLFSRGGRSPVGDSCGVGGRSSC